MPEMPEARDVEAPTIPGCVILRSLNEGGMGKVYLARQATLNRLVCVKVLAIPDGEDGQVWRSRFHREAELLARVSHPHILQIFGFGITDCSGLPYLVSEYIEGGDLRRHMTAGMPLPTDQALAILRQVCNALTYLHSRGILHRDLKPENVLMTDGGLVKVGDLGLAVEQTQAGVLTRSDRGMGTVGYISPEQHYALGVDERSDQFSLAALGYELLTGRRPLGAFPPPSQLNRRLSREFDTAILRGLAEEPKDRYSSVQDLMTALDRSLNSRRWRAPKLRITLAATFIVLCSAAGLAWSLGFGPAKGDGSASIALIKNFTSPDVVKVGPNAKPESEPSAKEQSDPQPKPPERSPEFTQLVELRAYTIWDRGGRPVGEAGETAKRKNWLEAESQICNEVDARAYRMWEDQGRPTGEAGEAVRKSNHRAAEAELLREAQAELQRHPIP